MKTITRIAGAGLIAAAFLGFAGGGIANASAPGSAGIASVAKAADGVMLTQAFYIRNYSSSEMHLQKIEGAGQNDGKPPINTVLLPGQSMRYEKVFWLGKTPMTTLRFVYWTPDGQIGFKDVRLIVDNLINVPWLELVDTPGQPIVTKAEHLPTHTDAIFSDSKESKITVPGSDAQRQAALINGMCEQSGTECTFQLTQPRSTAPDRTVVLDGGRNNTATARTFTTTKTNTTTATTSFELTTSAKASFAKAVEISVTAKYGVSLAKTETEMQSRTYAIAPYSVGLMVATMPMVRDHGTLTITRGGTTWTLNDIYLDSLDLSRTILYDTNERQLTQQERDTFKQDVDKVVPAPGQTTP